jgi:hypothetical protein
VADWRAFRALRRRGELGLRGWLKTVARTTLWGNLEHDDPLPALVAGAREVGGALVGLLPRLPGRRAAPVST